MPRLLYLILSVALLALTSTVNADDTIPKDVDREFAEFVRKGDKARFAGNTSAAITAYQDALQLRNDSRIVGRIGLVALDGGAIAEAMSYLLRAIIDSGKIPLPELQRIQFAYNRTRPLVTRVDIDVSHLGADVFMDGEPERLGTTAGEFYVFALPGKHEVKATLAGHTDAVVSIDAQKGETVRVELILTPVPVPLNDTHAEQEPAISHESKAEPAPCEVCKPSSQQPSPARTTANHKDDTRVQWLPGIGATLVYGAVSPYPAAGFSFSSYWTAGPVFSGGFDVRVAFSPRGINDYEIKGGTFTLLPGLCATRYWFTGCLTGHLGGMWHSWIAPSPGSMVRGAVGGGTNLGFRFGHIGRFDLRGHVYGELLLDEYPIKTGGNRASLLWTGPPYMIGLSLVAAWNGTK